MSVSGTDRATEFDEDMIRSVVTRAAVVFEAQWRRRSFSDAELLRWIAAGLEQLSSAIVTTAIEETGLPEARLKGELARTTRQLRAFASVSAAGEHVDAIIDTAQPDFSPPMPDQRRMAKPIGPVAVFEAGNFPLAFGVAGGDTASALAAGCPVVVKVHPGHPHTSALVAGAITDACAQVGGPEEWFAIVDGGAASGQALAQAPELEAIAFTGSFAGGRALHRAGSLRERPIPVFSEMGSLNPVLVTSTAARERGEAIADELAGAVGASLGQLCTKPGLIVLVDDAHGRALITTLRAALERVPAGRMLEPGIQRRFRSELLEACEDPRVDSLVHPDMDAELQAAALLELSAAHLHGDDARFTEIFGPAAIVAWTDDDSSLVQFAEGWTLGTLTATLYASDNEPRCGDIIGGLSRQAGRVVLNAPPTGVTVGRATVHGGPWPATSAPNSTSVGMTAVRRFMRPVGFQALPDHLLAPELQDANPCGIVRLVDGELTRGTVTRR